MAIRVNDRQLKTKLADEYFSSGDYDRALNFIHRFRGAERRQFKSKEFAAHYRLGMAACAANDFSQAHKHFSAAIPLAENLSDLKICEARLATLKRLILTPAPPLPASIRGRMHNHPDCEGKSFYDCASSEAIRAIFPAETLHHDSLQPEIDTTFAVGAYKSWWHADGYNPYSQAIKLAQRPQSHILLEPLGILLAEFISGGEAAVVRQQADFIIPIPAETADPDSWRYHALATIGGVMARRFGLPLFNVMKAASTPSTHHTRHSHHSPPPFTLTDPELVAGRHVLLLDDITTYRKTVKQAAAVLKAAGAQEVTAIILAYAEAKH